MRENPIVAEYKLLDYGYLKVVEAWGSDQRIVESARMSTDRGFVSWDAYLRCKRCDTIQMTRPSNEPHVEAGPCNPGQEHDWQAFPRGDLGLLSYLWKQKHSTPFEFAGLTIEVQAPIFVFREWHRHRTQGYAQMVRHRTANINELSARYSPMPNLDYLPTLERCQAGGGHLTKQARAVEGSVELTDDAALDWLARLEEHYARTQQLYEYGLGIGIPKELARLPLSVARYSRMRATGNLRGWLAFLALRFAPTAQYEIRVFAEVVDKLLVDLFPRTHQVAYGELP